MTNDLPPDQIAAIAALDDNSLEALMVDALTNVDFQMFDAACAEIDRRRGLRWDGRDPKMCNMDVCL